jgi:hypothetical protein
VKTKRGELGSIAGELRLETGLAAAMGSADDPAHSFKQSGLNA